MLPIPLRHPHVVTEAKTADRDSIDALRTHQLTFRMSKEHRPSIASSYRVKASDLRSFWRSVVEYCDTESLEHGAQSSMSDDRAVTHSAPRHTVVVQIEDQSIEFTIDNECETSIIPFDVLRSKDRRERRPTPSLGRSWVIAKIPLTVVFDDRSGSGAKRPAPPSPQTHEFAVALESPPVLGRDFTRAFPVVHCPLPCAQCPYQSITLARL